MVVIRNLVAVAAAVNVSGASASIFGRDGRVIDLGRFNKIAAREVTVTVTETLCGSYGVPTVATSTASTVTPASSTTSVATETPASISFGTYSVATGASTGGQSSISIPVTVNTETTGIGTTTTPLTSTTTAPTSVSKSVTVTPVTSTTHGTTVTTHSTAATSSASGIPPAVNAAGFVNANFGLVGLVALAALF